MAYIQPGNTPLHKEVKKVKAKVVALKKCAYLKLRLPV